MTVYVAWRGLATSLVLAGLALATTGCAGSGQQTASGQPPRPLDRAIAALGTKVSEWRTELGKTEEGLRSLNNDREKIVRRLRVDAKVEKTADLKENHRGRLLAEEFASIVDLESGLEGRRKRLDLVIAKAEAKERHLQRLRTWLPENAGLDQDADVAALIREWQEEVDGSKRAHVRRPPNLVERHAKLNGELKRQRDQERQERQERERERARRSARLERTGPTERACPERETAEPEWRERAKHENRLGFAAYHRDQYEQAIVHYSRAIQLDPTWKYHHNKGRSLLCLKRYQEAIEAYSNALKFDDQQAMTWNDLSWAHSRLGQFEKARQAFAAARRLDPGLPGRRAPADHSTIWR